MNEYIDGIMTQLAYFEEFHGILFMLKPNNASTGFEHTILELVRYFHKEVAHNIAFVSANARSSLFQPGNTLPNLKKLCKDKSAGELFRLKAGSDNCRDVIQCTAAVSLLIFIDTVGDMVT